MNPPRYPDGLIQEPHHCQDPRQHSGEVHLLARHQGQPPGPPPSPSLPFLVHLPLSDTPSGCRNVHVKDFGDFYSLNRILQHLLHVSGPLAAGVMTELLSMTVRFMFSTRMCYRSRPGSHLASLISLTFAWHASSKEIADLLLISQT